MNLDFSGVRIFVIGDPIDDIYRFGHVDRVSPEAPVPVFIEDQYEVREGGAANVAEQLRVLGCDTRYAWQDGNRIAWTEKTRYMVGSHQLLRVDRDKHVPNAIPALERFSAIVISDYAKGACTYEVCQQAITGAHRLKIPIIVDPKGKEWSKYEGATLICPNHLEVQPWAGDMVQKRGAEGLRYHHPGKPAQDFPATAHRVFDVTGAGDTVVAVLAACLGAGMSIEAACPIANAAAGYVVGEVGTTVCPLEKLRELCG
jgi:bifunctional ADP-heptose synthase (sugar kinase/adenylyltransferase)